MSNQLPYEVIKNYGDFELRSYPTYLLAQVQIRGDFVTAGNSAFNPLLQYITGKNANKAQMAMTSPVLQNSVEPDHHLVSFVLPVGVTRGIAPAPADDRVHLVEVEAHQAVARRFSGGWNFDRFLQNADELEDAVTEAIRGGWLAGEMVGDPYFARYNSPFTPWFMRRNEVIVALNTKA